ncbi:OLC1v1005724C1 [Oldenlandia corymbosa var. corymbosa]|uniref:OLC1v1005724C1 n=1 Tax=Oldenlandia corymbosa var. corymbosa TaxID=529605 RepID=A0AAV1DFA9_OLDCO|nr:OLC1v1005724C1 [Oldenlandia corymbosa var. corymbosa]
MANPQNVELEAAKFLHKLIQDSKDEPTKLATKLYVILQHMRSSGKENSMPYQVISRAMETVINQHGLDIEALMSSRHPLAPPGAQLGESGSSQVLGSSQRAGVSTDPKASLAGNELSKPDSYPPGISHVGPSGGGHDASNMTGVAGKVHGMTAGAASSYPPGETGVSPPTQLANSSFENHGFAGKMQGMEGFAAGTSSTDHYASKNIVGRTSEHEGGSSLLLNANKLNQVGMPSNVPETSMPRNVAPRDTGKAACSQAPVPGLLFKEHHLKQLRAQCLVFLAFRNGLMPKKLHLEIALGNFIPREEGARREMNDPKGKEQSVHEQHNMPEVCKPPAGMDNARGVDKLPSTGIYPEANLSPGADHTPNMKEDKSTHNTVPYDLSDERRLNLALRRKAETEMQKQERSESPASLIRGMQCDTTIRNIPGSSGEADSGTIQQQPFMSHPASSVSGSSKHMKPDVSSWPGNGCQLEAPIISSASGLMQESQRKEIGASQSQSPADGNNFRYRPADGNFPSLPSREQWKPIPGVDGHNVAPKLMKDSESKARNMLSGQETDTEYEDLSAVTHPLPKYTTLEKWVLERQKRKLLTEKTWAMKHQKTEQRKIAVCSAKLKENVSSSEDINAKTKSVIELKKLKLLDLQRHLRSDILSDFFKPIASEMDRLKSIKKHRIGRKSKQLERYEQKMKEERQKRIRERQKEFFSEVEVHRERLEDVFKIKRERWKGFNRYVREFHKRKERIHREKIDRIQREKINLLKINDVEGYLRMVQDAKSDRVKQLLKETEKYLQKLGSKLQDAKNMARRFETDVDDSKSNNMLEKNEISFENEDETDQAKHYLESNEKYYMMAHSVKENVFEQPTMLLGGKLREYQMNGLRWLVSLYNNHLNGILADEMGLGKTVQVISLLCYLMETKNDRGPFLVVVPSSVLPGWESEINFWAPSIQKIVYSGPPEERRRLFKEQIIQQKFNVLLTTYEYLMNKHDRPKLSKVHWHYIIIDEGHRIKNASCKLNADLKHYRSNHRLLLTGTPLQNNLEELWALLNFLLPNIFNSSEDFSQWFNKPFESNGDNSPDEALLSEEENLLIINRLHQVLRPFVLRRLKHKVENELPEKIERLIRCEASAYQKLLMKRVEENLGAIGTSKARSVHNSVMELRNICNHPYLSQLHVEEVHDFIPQHYLPNIVRLCGKLEMLDRLLPKLKATDHRVLLFSTMTRLLDVMEDYLCWKQYKYLRLDGHTSGGDRGALIDQFNRPGSPFFIFLLSIRAGGVGVNLQAADTVDLQAQARAHRIGQKKDVLVLRLETVKTVEEQVRASAEHKLGVANQSITAGFFDNNTSAEDRREYLESLLRECKKEEAAPVLDDDALNDVIARSESEIDVFESIDKKRREEEMGVWMQLVKGSGSGDSECLPPLPSRLLMDDDLKAFYEAMKISELPQKAVESNVGMKRKGDSLGGLDTRHYGRGKRAREVRSYEEQLTEEEFEKLCQVESPDSPPAKDITEKRLSIVMSDTAPVTSETQQAQLPLLPSNPTVEPASVQSKEVTPPSKRGRGRPRRTPATTDFSPSPGVQQLSSGAEQISALTVVGNVPHSHVPDLLPGSIPDNTISAPIQQISVGPSVGIQSASLPPVPAAFQPTNLPEPSMPVRGRGRGRKAQSGAEPPRRRGKRQTAVTTSPTPTRTGNIDFDATQGVVALNSSVVNLDSVSQHSGARGTIKKEDTISQSTVLSPSTSGKSDFESPQVQVLNQVAGSAPGTFSGSLLSPEGLVPNQSNKPASDDSLAGKDIELLPAPASGSSVMANVTQDPIALGSSCSNPVAIPAIASVSQVTTLSGAAPKGRGRGRKAQSGVEMPRRRGKRQNPEASASFEVSNQDSKSAEVPEKKPRVNAGRRPTRRSKLEDEVMNQSNVPQSIDSETITSSAFSQVPDSKSQDKAVQAMNIALLDGSQNLADSVGRSSYDDKKENKDQESTESAQTGASKGIEAAMVKSNKVQEEDEAPKNSKVHLSNPSQDIDRLPADQISKSADEEPKQMRNVDSDFLKVNANSIPLDESKPERGSGTQNPGELDEPVVKKDPLSTKNGDELEEAARKLVNLDQSDPSPSIQTPARGVEQEDLVSKPTKCLGSDVSQSISELSREQMEDNNAVCQMNGKTINALPSLPVSSVVILNKDLLLHNMDADTPHNKSDPPLCDVNQESEAREVTDVRVDISFEISDSVPTVKHQDIQECDGVANEEADVRLDSSGEISESVPEEKPTANQDCEDVNQGSETREECDVRLDLSIETSVSAPEVKYCANQESEAHDETDLCLDMSAKMSESVQEVKCAVDEESDCQHVNQATETHESDSHLNLSIEVSESAPEVKCTANQESDDMSAEISESVPEVQHAAKQESDCQDVNQGSKTHEESDMHQDTSVGISESAPEVMCPANQETDGQDVNQETDGQDVNQETDEESDTPLDINAEISESGPEVGQDVNQESEAQKEIDVQLDVSNELSESAPKDRNADNHEDDQVLCNVCVSGTLLNNVDSSVGERRNVEQKDGAEEGHAQADKAMVSAADIVAEHIDDKNETESRHEVGDGIGEAVKSFEDLSNEEPPNKESLAAVLSALPTEDNILGISAETDITEFESKETTSGYSLASQAQLRPDSLSEESSHPALAIVQSATEVSSGVGELATDKLEQDDVEGKDGALVSDPKLINKEYRDDLVLPTSSLPGISSLATQSHDGEAFAPVSSFVKVVSTGKAGLSENLTEEDGIKKVEYGSQTSELVNEVVAAPDSELLDEGYDGCGVKTASEERENDITMQDSTSVFCIDKNVASTSDHACKLEDLHEKGNSDDSGNKASGCPEVPLLNQSAATESSREMLHPTSGTVQPAVKQSETVSQTECKESEDHDDRHGDIDTSVESLMQKVGDSEASVTVRETECKESENHADHHGNIDAMQKVGDTEDTCCPEIPLLIQSAATESASEMPTPTSGTVQLVLQQSETVSKTECKISEDDADHHGNIDASKVGDTEASSGKANSEEFKYKNDLVSAHALVEKQSLGKMTSSPSSTHKAESSLPVSPGVEFQIGEDESTSKVVEEKTSSPLHISDINLPHVGPQEESNITMTEATIENVELKETTILNAETNELMPDASNLEAENEVDVEQSTVLNAEASVEQFKILEETTISHAEAAVELFKTLEETTTSNAETRAIAKVERSENEAEMQLLEENTPMNRTREVFVSSVEIMSSADALPHMDESVNDPMGDNMEKHESNDEILQVESIGKVDVTSDLVLKSVESMNITNAGVVADSSAHSAVEMIPNAEVAEDKSDHSTVEIAESLNCADNLMNTINDHGDSSSSLLMASPNVTPAEVLVEKFEIAPEDSVEAQGNKDNESEKTAVSDPEIHEAQGTAQTGISQSRNGLQQLFDQYSDATADVEDSIADSLSVDMRNNSQSSGDALLSPPENEKENLQGH